MASLSGSKPETIWANLATQRKFAGTLAEFRTATIAELRRTKAGMVDHLPAVKAVR